jgi:hypothetical protein
MKFLGRNLLFLWLGGAFYHFSGFSFDTWQWWVFIMTASGLNILREELIN